MNKCKFCKYCDKQLGSCDYMIITGNQRPCPPGEKCTVGSRAILKDFCVLLVCVIALLSVAVCCVLPVALAVVRDGWWARLIFEALGR